MEAQQIGLQEEYMDLQHAVATVASSDEENDDSLLVLVLRGVVVRNTQFLFDCVNLSCNIPIPPGGLLFHERRWPKRVPWKR